MRWQLEGQRIAVQANDVQFANADAQGEARATWHTSDASKAPHKSRFPGVLDLTGTLNRAAWRSRLEQLAADGLATDPQIGSHAPGAELRARDTLHRICDLAERTGQVFTLENLNPIDHPGCPFGSTAAVLGLVSAVNRPQLRINLDLYHTQIGEGDLIRWCQACLPWIGEVQVADNPGRCGQHTADDIDRNLDPQHLHAKKLCRFFRPAHGKDMPAIAGVVQHHIGGGEHQDQEQHRAGGDDGPVLQARADLAGDEGRRRLRPAVGEDERKRILVPRRDEAEHGGSCDAGGGLR